MTKVKVAIAGVGNCASALIQGLEYYKNNDSEIGLIKHSIGGITPDDIEFVCAFDVHENKIGKDLSEAIFVKPNNTVKISDVSRMGITVEKAPVSDGIGKYLKDVVPYDKNVENNIADRLDSCGAEILLNYLPVGSTNATHLYANACLESKTAFINSIPVFIASDKEWQKKFQDKGLPVAGDDVMSQLGATVLHKTLVKLAIDRGIEVDETYQLNIGGDTDFLNMLEESRLVDKRESKTSAVRAMSPYPIPTRIGPSDYVDFLDNEKICYIWLKGRYFGNIPVMIDAKLHVVDAFNSGGVVIDAIRATKIALDRNVSGPLNSISSYCFKHPPVQLPYNVAKQQFLDFVDGKLER